MANVVRNPYSNTAGNTPSSLGNGVLAVNQADGRLFYRNGVGAVTTFSSIASYATAGSFPAVGLSTLLYLAADSSRIYQWSGVYAEIGVASGYTLPNATSSSLGGVVVGTGLSVDGGTVSANVVSVAGRTGTVTISSSDVSGLPTAGTGSTNYCAGNDARLSDSRTAVAHASSHATGGNDPITISSGDVSGLGSLATADANNLTLTGLLTTQQFHTSQRYTEAVAAVSISSNTLTLDLSASNIFACTLNANVTTFTISNTPATSGIAIGFTVIFTADGTPRTVAWPSSFKWAGGTAPTITGTIDKRDVFTLVSPDNGSSWLAFVGGQNF